MSNEVLNVIKKRRSIRTYKADAIPEEILNAVLEAGTFAPTGGGKQSPIIVAITLPQENMMLAAASLGFGLVWVHREREIFDNLKGKTLLKEWGGIGVFKRSWSHCTGISGFIGCESGRKKRELYCSYIKTKKVLTNRINMFIICIN